MFFIQAGLSSGLDKDNTCFEKGGTLFEKEPEKKSSLFTASADYPVGFYIWLPVI